MRLAAGLLTPAFLAGCVGVSPPAVEDPAVAWELRQSQLGPVASWRLHGRLAMRTPDQGWHATLDWERDGERHRMDFTGPLGRGHLRLIQDGQGAELRDADRRTWRAQNAEQILYRVTGWSLPIQGLNYWILGLPAPALPSDQQLDSQGRLKNLAQSGWRIEFREYARYGSFDLPVKMFIKKDRESGRPEDDMLEARLVIERWSFKQ